VSEECLEVYEYLWVVRGGGHTAVERRLLRFISKFPFMFVITGTRMKSSSIVVIDFQCYIV
jgi:hypothetical protein